jgi:hypothetical protein
MSAIDKMKPLTAAASEVLSCLFLIGPTQDGDVPCKCGRDDLYKAGLIDRADGWQWLTRDGVMLGLGMGLDREKERRQRDRSIPQ